MSTYVGYLDTVHGVFPILDYFLPSNGLVSGIVDKDLWGISYGVDVKVPNLGFPWGSTMHGVRNPMHSPPSDMMPSSVLKRRSSIQ